MKLVWEIEADDVARVKAFYDEHKDNDLVVHRRKTNVEGEPPKFSRSLFWKTMISRLLTTQQRAGPDSAVSRFSGARNFPLSFIPVQGEDGPVWTSPSTPQAPSPLSFESS